VPNVQQGTVVNGWLWNTRATNTVTCCSRLVPVIVVFVLIHGNSPCIILFNAIQVLIHVDDWNSACLRREVWHIRNLWMSMGYTDTNRWRCHNCCCGKIAVENLTWYRTVIGTGPTEGPQSTSWPSVWSTTLLAERARVSRQSFSSSAVLITTGCLWFDHLIPCALRQWRKLMSQDISYIISTSFLKRVFHYGKLVRYFSLCVTRTGVVDGINLSPVPTKVRGSAVLFAEFVIPFETELWNLKRSWFAC
jgi:hypothetical protein